MNYNNIPEEEIQVYKTWKHLNRGASAYDIAKCLRISYSSALNKLNSSVRSGSLMEKFEIQNNSNRYVKRFHPSMNLIDKCDKIENQSKNIITK